MPEVVTKPVEGSGRLVGWGVEEVAGGRVEVGVEVEDGDPGWH